MKRALWLVIPLILLIALAGCGGAETPAPTATPEPTTPPPTATLVPPPPPAEPAADPATSSEPPTVLDLSETQLASLENLDSYAARTLMRNDGVTSAGQPDQSSIEITTRYNSDPLARHIIMAASRPITPGQPPATETIEFYQVADQVYGNVQGEWALLDPQNSPFNTPDIAQLMNSGVMFADLGELESAGPAEDVNGIPSQHFSFNESDLGGYLNLTAQDQVTAQGDLWIAKDGGFVTRYNLDTQIAQGNGGVLAPGLVSGSFHMEFELSQANSDLVIEIPAEALASSVLLGFEDSPFPRPAGSQLSVTSSSFTMLTTPIELEAVQAFYLDELSAQGWTHDEAAITEHPGFVNLVLTKEDLTLNLGIATDPNSGQTQIMATVEAAP